MRKSLLLSTALVAVFAAAQANAFEVKDNVNLNTIFKDGIVKDYIWSQTGKTGTLTTSNINITSDFDTAKDNVKPENWGRSIVYARENSKLILGNENTNNLTISATKGKAVYAEYGSQIELRGKVIDINSVGDANVPSSGRSVVSWDPNSKITLTGDDVNIHSVNGDIAVMSKAEAALDISAKNVDIVADNGNGVHAGNNTLDSKGPLATLNIKADNINIKADGKDGYAVGAMSQGIVNIDGNTTLKGKNALLTRGYAKTTINKSGKNTVKMDGDINFNYMEDTSNTPIDANVDVTLSGADSYWTGNTIVEYEYEKNKPSEEKLKVTGATINLKDGATWNATAITDNKGEKDGYYYTALNNLNVDKGTINILDTTRGVSVDTLNAKDTTVTGGVLNINKAMNVTGDLTLDSGTAGDGTITFAKGSNLSVKVNKTAIANNVINNGATLNMVFDTGFEGEYKIVTGSLDKEFDGYNNNALYNIASSKNGTYQISKKTAQEISEAVSATQNEANVIAALTAQSDTGNAKANIIANSINDALQSGNEAEIAAAKEAASALAPDVAPVVSQTETTVANQIYSAIGTRLSGGINNANQGISSGDMLDDAAVWVQGLYNKSKLNNTSKAYGYDADTYGAAFGLEKYVTKATKLGAGYAYNSTDIDGHNRDTDVHTSTLFAYGEYKPNNWFVNGIMSYGWSDYKEKKHSVVDVKSKYDVDTFGLQAMTGYDINLPQAFTLTPEAGVRYAHVDQDSYTDDAGQSVKSHKGNIWTGVAGAKLSKAFAADNGMIFKPELRFAATYDLKNDKGNTLVTLANGTSYFVQGTALKRFGVEVGAGVTADLSDNVELSMGYEGRFRSHYQDHTGLINAKYKF